MIYIYKEVAGAIIGIAIMFILFFLLFPGDAIEFLQDKTSLIADEVISFLDSIAQNTFIRFLEAFKDRMIDHSVFETIRDVLSNVMEEEIEEYEEREKEGDTNSYYKQLPRMYANALGSFSFC